LAGIADRLTATARFATDRPDDVALLLAALRPAAADGSRTPARDRTAAREPRAPAAPGAAPPGPP
ncbi:hypothetical protein, partial [Streptomyces sp. SID161]|uniref:hypothetical protein n=1 Tax=Streptomyces sp. SID161 TaxID=2690251 RepID=UPI0013F6D6F9